MHEIFLCMITYHTGVNRLGGVTKLNLADALVRLLCANATNTITHFSDVSL